MKKLSRQKLNIWISIAIYIAIIPSVIAIGVFLLGDRKYNLVSIAIAFLACVPPIIGFEKGKTGARELTIIATMIVLSVVGRIIFTPLPGFKPVTAIVIITGIAFGSSAGFITGAMSALLSNIFYGQGPWTPFQMVAWGFIGAIAGLIFKRDKKPNIFLLIIMGILGGITYSLLMDIWATLSMGEDFNIQRYIAYFISSVPFMLTYAISNVVFLLFLANPILAKLNRIKLKYGVFANQNNKPTT